MKKLMGKIVAQTIEFAEEDEPPSGKAVNAKIIDITSAHRDTDLDLNNRARNFIRDFFPKTTSKEWNNWRWQIKNSITDYGKLKSMLRLSEEENFAGFGNPNSLPLRVTPYYASLLVASKYGNPIRKSVIPTSLELVVSPAEESDPLAEESTSPTPNIVHRYPDRVLFLATNFCSTYCRYCTRSHMVAKNRTHLSNANIMEGIEYIKAHHEIRDVLISGGDPLTMPDHQLEFLLSNIRAIPHVEIIRIGSKVPAVLPQRITKQLVTILKKYHPLWISLHFTHPDEITPETSRACNMLADAGIPLGSQTVLLKGINDNVETMKSLFHKLLMNRVRPYYIYQCDPILGSGHFRTPVSKGIEIIEGLRGHTSGYAVPHFVIDAPHGGGKIPLIPNYVLGREPDSIVLRNYENKIFRYPDTV